MTRKRVHTADIASHVGLLLAVLVFGYPVVWMIFGAAKSSSSFFHNLWGPPTHIRWANIAEAWTVGHIGLYSRNSVIVSGLTLVLVCVLAYPLSYAIARMQFRGSHVVLVVFTGCLFVPIQLVVVPLFDLTVRLHLLDTYWAMILPYTASSLPFAVMFLTAYLRAIPKDMEEAAMLDGAGHWTILMRIFLPISRPALATVVVFTFLNVWNEMLIALTLTQSPGVRTLPVGLLNFSQTTGTTNYSLLFAGLTMATVPVLVLFVLIQRQFLRGLMAGAVKM